MTSALLRIRGKLLSCSTVVVLFVGCELFANRLLSPCHALEANDRRADGLERRLTGDPYELTGKRLVFTSWYYVRPGSYTWEDASGNVVTANKAADIGPWDAQFKRKDVPRGIRLVAQPARRRGPILQLEPPWQVKNVNVRTMLKDNEMYRLWAGYGEVNGKSSHPCYFDSLDGVTWNAPNLNLVEFDGTTKNNLLPVCPEFIFKDESASDDERYKGVSLEEISKEDFALFKKLRPDAWEHRADRTAAGFIYAVRGYVSPDGIAWTQLPEPLVVEHSDTVNITVHYDAIRKKYVMYTRNWYVGPKSDRAPKDSSNMSWLGDAPGAGRRCIGRSESDDFRKFPLSEVILIPGPEMAPSEVLYTNCRTTVPGAPEQNLMFPTIWDTNGDTTKIVMASSHDGAVWNYLPGGPALDSKEFGQWDGGTIFTSPELVELPDGAFALPYTGYNFPHKYPRGLWKYQIGVAEWPKGRIVALEAKDQGEFATVGIMPPGRKLLINATTERVGSIVVEVADLQGTPLTNRTFNDSRPIQGDHYRSAVAWKESEDLGHEDGQPIVLRFRMNRAKIFGLDFD